jgi:hypothetical protein
MIESPTWLLTFRRRHGDDDRLFSLEKGQSRCQSCSILSAAEHAEELEAIKQHAPNTSEPIGSRARNVTSNVRMDPSSRSSQESRLAGPGEAADVAGGRYLVIAVRRAELLHHAGPELAA